MATADFTTTIVVDQTPEAAFNAINNVRAWWTENLEGRSQKVNDEFTVRFHDIHISTQKLVEVTPGSKIVWLVTDATLNFVKDKHEWINTKIYFEIAEKDGKTQIRFTHVGLVPKVECYDACVKGWSQYINGSLFKLLTEGKGMPEPKY